MLKKALYDILIAASMIFNITACGKTGQAEGSKSTDNEQITKFRYYDTNDNRK